MSQPEQKVFASEKDLSLIAKTKKKIDDLESILPEILEKVQEAQALKKEREAMKNTLKSTLKSAFGFGTILIFYIIIFIFFSIIIFILR